MFTWIFISLLLGDYVDKDTEAVHQIVPFLKQLNAKYGVFACLGNHDYKGASHFDTTSLKGCLKWLLLLYREL